MSSPICIPGLGTTFVPAPREIDVCYGADPGLSLCKADADFKDSQDDCTALNAAVLARHYARTFHAISCQHLVDPTFSELTALGAKCCGDGERRRMRCLDSSSLCQADDAYDPGAETPELGGSCAFWDGYLLSLFPGQKLNWADVTCEELASTKYPETFPGSPVPTFMVRERNSIATSIVKEHIL